MELTKNTRKEITSLRIKKYRDNSGKFLAEGIKVVQEALKSDFEIDYVVVRGSVSNEDGVKEIMKLAGKRHIEFGVVKDKEYKGLSSLDTDPGVLAVVRKKEEEPAEGNYVLLDEVKDPGNMGTIIRTADWFAVSNIVLSKGCVDVYNPKTIQASMGSIFHVAVLEDIDLKEFIPDLQKGEYEVYAAALEGESKIQSVPDAFALLLGSESHGVKKELLNLADKKITIPGSGKAESLNVGVAAGILLEKLTAV